MNHEDTIFMLLVDANPIPDVDDMSLEDIVGSTYLVTLEQRSSGMTQLLEKPERSHKRSATKWLLAAASAAAIVIGIVIVSNLNGDESAPPATVPPPVSTTAIAEFGETQARGIVDAAFAAHNAGDMETWAAWREGPAPRASDFDYEMAAGSRITVEECNYRGFALWDMDDGVEGHGFDCTASQTDNLLDAAGIRLEMTYNWVINEQPGRSLGGSNENLELAQQFLNEFLAWLQATKPEVFETIEMDTFFERPLPESVPTLLDYVDEFVAQSDNYPLAEPVAEQTEGGPLVERQP